MPQSTNLSLDQIFEAASQLAQLGVDAGLHHHEGDEAGGPRSAGDPSL